jgi:hypothetical protein
MIRILILVCIMASIPLSSLAQANEIAFVMGGTSSPDSSTPFPTATTRTPLKIGSGITYESVFAHRLINAPIVSAYLELPIVGTPSRTISAINVATRDFSSIFFTPAMKINCVYAAG